MSISDEAVEAAADRMQQFCLAHDRDGVQPWTTYARAALEAAAPYMLEEVERELTDAKRVIALLVSEAGGKVAVSRRAITELSNDTVIETAQDVIHGGWVIRTTNPRG